MIEKIKNICLENQEIESCGLFSLNEDNIVKIFNCKNIHKAPQSDFEISIEEFLIAEDFGKIIGVYHSHTKDCMNTPSKIDYLYSEFTGYFNVVYIIVNDKFYIIDPKNRLTQEIKEQIGL